MIMFLLGFGVASAIFAIMYFMTSYGVNLACKSGEMAIAIYNDETDTWKVTKQFRLVADRIEYRMKTRPDSVKKFNH